MILNKFVWNHDIADAFDSTTTAAWLPVSWFSHNFFFSILDFLRMLGALSVRAHEAAVATTAGVDGMIKHSRWAVRWGEIDGEKSATTQDETSEHRLRTAESYGNAGLTVFRFTVSSKSDTKLRKNKKMKWNDKMAAFSLRSLVAFSFLYFSFLAPFSFPFSVAAPALHSIAWETMGCLLPMPSVVGDVWRVRSLHFYTFIQTHNFLPLDWLFYVCSVAWPGLAWLAILGSQNFNCIP